MNGSPTPLTHYLLEIGVAIEALEKQITEYDRLTNAAGDWETHIAIQSNLLRNAADTACRLMRRGTGG